MFRRAVHRVDVIVAIMKEIANVFPWTWLHLTVFAPQRFIERGEALMGLTIRTV